MIVKRGKIVLESSTVANVSISTMRFSLIDAGVEALAPEKVFPKADCLDMVQWRS